MARLLTVVIPPVLVIQRLTKIPRGIRETIINICRKLLLLLLLLPTCW